jgi:hypothetical protein
MITLPFRGRVRVGVGYVKASITPVVCSSLFPAPDLWDTISLEKGDCRRLRETLARRGVAMARSPSPPPSPLPSQKHFVQAGTGREGDDCRYFGGS